MSLSIRDVRSSYVAGHQHEATKPNGYNISVISDYIKDSHYSKGQPLLQPPCAVGVCSSSSRRLRLLRQAEPQRDR
jgi:hypothetical protein